jgi:hypothetical protein
VGRDPIPDAVEMYREARAAQAEGLRRAGALLGAAERDRGRGRASSSTLRAVAMEKGDRRGAASLNADNQGANSINGLGHALLSGSNTAT